jgi:hypothetical protein
MGCGFDFSRRRKGPVAISLPQLGLTRWRTARLSSKAQRDAWRAAVGGPRSVPSARVRLTLGLPCSGQPFPASRSRPLVLSVLYNFEHPCSKLNTKIEPPLPTCRSAEKVEIPGLSVPPLRRVFVCIRPRRQSGANLLRSAKAIISSVLDRTPSFS